MDPELKELDEIFDPRSYQMMDRLLKNI